MHSLRRIARTATKAALTMALVSAAAASNAQAQLLTAVGSLNPTVTTINDFGLHNTSVTSGYNAVVGGANNINMQYTGGSGLFFDYCGWGLGSNGQSCINSVGINQAGLLKFSFNNGPVSGVGVNLNYAPGFGQTWIRARDSFNNILAEFDLDASAPISGSPFQFRGIQFNTASIASFEIEGTQRVSAIMSDLSFTSTPSSTVPEPSTVVLMASGLVGLAGFARRRAAKAKA